MRQPGSPPSRLRRPLYLEFVRLFLAVVFVATAVGKLLDNRGFAEVLATFELLPTAILLPFALAISLTELALALWLFSRRQMRQAAIAAFAFNLGYVAWLAVALARGLEIPNCGCFGVFWARPLTPYMLLEDSVLILASVVLILALPKDRNEQT